MGTPSNSNYISVSCFRISIMVPGNMGSKSYVWRKYIKNHQKTHFSGHQAGSQSFRREGFGCCFLAAELDAWHLNLILAMKLARLKNTNMLNGTDRKLLGRFWACRIPPECGTIMAIVFWWDDFNDFMSGDGTASYHIFWGFKKLNREFQNGPYSMRNIQ